MVEKPSQTTARESGTPKTEVRRRGFLTAAGIGTATALTGCTRFSDGGDEGGPLTLGGVYLLSGVGEALGSASRAAVEVAVDEINDDGGIDGREVETLFRDHGDSPQEQIRSLVQEEGAELMVGLTSSGVTLNSGPTIEQLEVPFMLTDIGTPFITEHDTDTYGDYYGEDGKAAGRPNIFRTNANTSINVYAIAQYVADEYGSSRIANMGPDYAYGQQCWDYFQAYSEGLGVEHEYVESVFPELSASDMTPQINQVLDADPELVFTSFWGGDSVTFVGGATEQGLFEQADDVFDTLGADPNQFAALGDRMPEGYSYSGWYWHSAFDNEENDRFLEAYREEFENSGIAAIPSVTGGSSYAAPFLFKEAIEAAGGTDPDDLVAELEGIEFTGPRGSWKIDPDSHQATAPTVIGETSTDDDVPYDGVGLTNTQTYTLDRGTAEDLLSGSDLPPGI